MARFEIDASEIRDMSAFHEVFARTLKFFDGYGRNMDGWIDCMTDLHGPRALSALNLPEGEEIDIVLEGTQDLSRRRLLRSRGVRSMKNIDKRKHGANCPKDQVFPVNQVRESQESCDRLALKRFDKGMCARTDDEARDSNRGSVDATN